MEFADPFVGVELREVLLPIFLHHVAESELAGNDVSREMGLLLERDLQETELVLFRVDRGLSRSLLGVSALDTLSIIEIEVGILRVEKVVPEDGVIEFAIWHHASDHRR